MKGDFHVRFCENVRVKFPCVTRCVTCKATCRKTSAYAVKQMEGFPKRRKELDFRRRLSGVAFKPPYAACIGNRHVVSDKEKRGQRPL